MRVANIVAVSVLLLALSSCGPALRPPPVSQTLLEQEARLQKELLFKTLVDRRSRLQRIYTALRIANADLCGSRLSPVTGIIGIDRLSLPKDLWEPAQRLFGVNDGVTVIDVAPASPAATAGLKARDVITGAAKGTRGVPSGWTYSALTVAELVKVIEQSDGQPLTLLVRRDGHISPLNLLPQRGCSYPLELASNDSFNAFADGERIVVYTGLFNHVPDDREIAVLVGHELAHNILKHTEKSSSNAAIGGAAGLALDIGLAVLGVNTQGAFYQAGAAAGAKAYSQEFESEADYLGLYMLARSGMDISVAPDFYRRMGIQHPGSQIKDYRSSHPSTPERAAAMQQTIEEIQQKNATQQALLPTTRPGEVLTVRSPTISTSTVVTATTLQPAATVVPTTALAFAPQTNTSPQPSPPVQLPTTPAPASRSFAQLYLIKGKIVSNPPQSFNAEFLDTGKASVVLSGRRLATGDFELFDLHQSITNKYRARLVKADSVKPFPGADAKGFATFSDVDLEVECAYAFARSTGRGEGTCADNQGNVYRIVF